VQKPVIHHWKTLSALYNYKVEIEDLGLSWRHFGLGLPWRTRVWLARESNHQVL